MLRPIAMLVDSYPVLSETFVAGEADVLAAFGHRVRVEAGAHPRVAGRPAAGVPFAVARNDPFLHRALALLWLVTRHPRRCGGDLRARARWRREEEPRPLLELAPVARRIDRFGAAHLHAHFAAGGALDALRLSRLLGLPYTVTAHANDIYARPRNLREKLERAEFAASGCAYTVGDLRRLAPAAVVHEQIMGVDPDRFSRAGPLPQGRNVLAVGRLVEKKGFADLIDAVALIPADELRRVVVVGDGPLRRDLEARIAGHGLQSRITVLGARTPDEVHRLLGSADALAMPCVVAGDGDRDSMPLVVKEAMSMQLLVVASDEVGLPEIVAPPYGFLHRPGDPADLARALRAALATPPEEREAAGLRAREVVRARADVRIETAKLSRLIQEIPVAILAP